MIFLFILATWLPLAASMPSPPPVPPTTPPFGPLISNSKFKANIGYQLARSVIGRSLGETMAQNRPRIKRNVAFRPHPYGDLIPFRLSEAQVITLNISVGSPPQTVEVLADTGSPCTWVTVPHNSTEKKIQGYDPSKSSSWLNDSRTGELTYLDSSSCKVQIGQDIISVGNTTLQLQMGVGSGEGCEGFDMGILGLSKDSAFLKALVETTDTPVYSFSFKDTVTGEGNNWFAIGGLAGLKEEDIIWTQDKNKGVWSRHFQSTCLTSSTMVNI